uniref:Uncharacterized protein n=1 Tax=Mola mola TaxID=94237 RepID=A0A3Q3VT93_MOLML
MLAAYASGHVCRGQGSCHSSFLLLCRLGLQNMSPVQNGSTHIQDILALFFLHIGRKRR